MRVNTSLSGVLAPGVLAGVIYVVIAVATGARTAPAIIGGVVIAAVAVAIGTAFRLFYKRRSSRNC